MTNHKRALLIEALGIDSLEWQQKYQQHIAPIVTTHAPLSRKIEQLAELQETGILSTLELAFISFILGESGKAAVAFL